MSYNKGYKYAEEQPGLSGHLDVKGWRAMYIGKGIWELIPQLTDTNNCMIMTGNAVTLDAHIPISHRLVRFEWKHTDDTYGDAADATEAILSRIDHEPDYANLLWRLYYEAASTSSTTVVPFGEGYEYQACTYRVSFNTTVTNYVWPKLWVQEVKP